MGAIVDTKLLRQLEAVIDRGMKSFVEVGNALAQIRDSKLYREHYKTFEAYVEDRFGFKRAHAYRLIDSAKVASELSPTGDKIPNERQIRELAKAPPEQREEIWEDVVENEPEPTAKAVRERVEAKKETQAKPTRQEVKDSNDAERERIERWATQFETFENPIIAVRAIITKLDSQQLSMVRLMLEV